MNKNNRTVHNIIVKTILEDEAIKSCDGVGANYFLLKYFKFECFMCSRLHNNVLVADCCKSPICLTCTQELCDQYEVEGPLTFCIFCNKEIQKCWYIRDPY